MLLLTVVQGGALGVSVCLPALGSWWDFSCGSFRPGPPTSGSVRPFRPISGGGSVPSAFAAVQWAALPEECCLPDAVPLVSVLDSFGNPTTVLDWSELTFTLGCRADG